MLDYKNCQKTALSSSQFGKWQISVMYQFGDIFKIEFRREGENVRVSNILLMIALNTKTCCFSGGDGMVIL